MSLLVNLPQELASLQLSTWLTIADVARLDSAFCNYSSRNEFLQIAYQSGTTLQYGKDVQLWNEVTEAMNDWIFKKSATVCGFRVTSTFVNDHAARKKYLKQYGGHIVWIDYSSMFDPKQDPRVHRISVLDVAQTCPSLTRLDGSGCLDDAVLWRIAERCPLLEELVVVGTSITSRVVKGLARRCAKLKKVRLGAPHLTEECLIWFVRGHPGLTSFDTCALGATPKFMRALALTCRGLAEFLVNSVSVAQASIHLLLQQCPSLSHLHLESCELLRSYQDGSVAAVSTSMRVLHLNGVNVDYRQLEDLLCACPGLTTLYVRGCEQLLMLEYTDLGKFCPQLQTLAVYGNASVPGDPALRGICAHCTVLRALTIHESYLESDIFYDFPEEEWEGWIEYELEKKGVLTDRGLIAVARKFPLLEELDVTRCDCVTDAALVALAQSCRGLRVLIMRDCYRVTDAGVAAVMEGCPRLVELGVEGSGVSEQTLRAVRARYPRTRL